MITDSVLRKDKNHRPQVFFEKYIIKEKDSARKRVSPSDDSDEERSDDFDKEIFDE